MQKWIKKGLIFEPDGSIEWMNSHASCPTAEQIEGDLFRIYFTPRDKHNRSQIGFVEVDITNPKEIVSISHKPILVSGELGTFDDSGAWVSCIVNNANKKYLYYVGWNQGITVPFRNSIGLAISNDGGKTFQKYSEGPIIDRNAQEPHFSATSYVILKKNIWKMWYLSCKKWVLIENKPTPYYHIKYAESKDGINWERKGIVCIDFKNEKEHAISRPCVLFEDGIYKMWYSYRGPKTYRIGYAESLNGINWTRKDEEVGLNVSNSGWDSEMIEYPLVFNHKGTKYMLYNGNNYGESGFGFAVLE